MLTPLEDLKSRLAYFDTLFGPEGDCGDSCMFVSVNDLRELVKMIPETVEA